MRARAAQLVLILAELNSLFDEATHTGHDDDDDDEHNQGSGLHCVAWRRDIKQTRAPLASVRRYCGHHQWRHPHPHHLLPTPVILIVSAS